jgi:hypothetical protein
MFGIFAYFYSQLWPNKMYGSAGPSDVKTMTDGMQKTTTGGQLKTLSI